MMVKRAHGLELTMVRDPARSSTRCTVEIPDELQVGAGPPPRYAVMGDEWIELHEVIEDPIMRRLCSERGYWDLAPEGLAMKFLRLAWLAAKAETMAQQAPFDGDPTRSWDKGAPGGDRTVWRR